MRAKKYVAKKLYRSVSKGGLTFHGASRLFRMCDAYFSRKKSPAARCGNRALLKYISEATSSEVKGAWTSILFPAEILHTFDIHPITLEVMSGMFSSIGLSPMFLGMAEEMDVPPAMCSFHRMLMGISKSGILGTPAVVGSTSLLCDGNLKTFAEAAKEQRVPFIFIDIPYEESADGIDYVKGQLKDAMKALSEATGVKGYTERLRRMLENANRAFAALRRFYDLYCVNRKNLFRAHEVANFAFPNHFLLGRKELVRMVERRCRGVRSDTKRDRFFSEMYTGEKVRRLMWLHIVPQYDTPIWKIIDNGGTSRVVCDEYSTVLYDDYDLSDPLGSIAARLIKHPSNGPLERRIEHIVKVARDFNVEGMIHYSSWGCHQASGNVSILGRELEAAGFKFLNINGDAADQRNSSFEQHRTRLEAFLESYGQK